MKLGILPVVLLAATTSTAADLDLQSYSSAVHAGKSLARASAEGRIRREVFASRNETEYRARLTAIDRFALEDPGAGYALARALELHWEYLYVRPAQAGRSRKAGAAAKTGTLIGLALLGTASIVRPEKLPQFFRLLRMTGAFAPFVGAKTGGALLLGAEEGSAPFPAPAQVLKLGVSEGELVAAAANDEAQALIAEAFGLGAGILASELFAKGVGAVRWGTLPLRLTPVSFALSFVAGELAASGYRSVHAASEWRHHQQALLGAVRGLESPNHYLAADHVVQEAEVLSAQALAPLYEIWGEILRVHRAPTIFDLGRSWRVREGFRNEVAEQLRALDLISVATYAGIWPQDSAPGLSKLLARYRAWRRAQDSILTALGWTPDRELELLAYYARSMRSQLEEALSTELRNGQVSRHPTLVLLQARAILARQHDPWLESQIELLDLLIARADALDELVLGTREE